MNYLKILVTYFSQSGNTEKVAQSICEGCEGQEVQIKNLAYQIAELTEFKGKILFDKNQPEGQLRRMLDTSRARQSFDFTAEIDLHTGLKKTIEWYKQSLIIC